VLVATLGGRIVGAVQIEWRDPAFWPDRPGGDALYIRRLVVDRGVVGRAVAQRLLLDVAAIARGRHRWRLRLDCAPLAALARIYRRLGFTQIDESDLGGYRVYRFERLSAPRPLP
jgi:GNAT superfamily N-acetyltransferase